MHNLRTHLPTPRNTTAGEDMIAREDIHLIDNCGRGYVTIRKGDPVVCRGWAGDDVLVMGHYGIERLSRHSFKATNQAYRHSGG